MQNSFKEYQEEIASGYRRCPTCQGFCKQGKDISEAICIECGWTDLVTLCQTEGEWRWEGYEEGEG